MSEINVQDPAPPEATPHLEAAGLVRVRRQVGKSPVVTLRPLPAEGAPTP